MIDSRTSLRYRLDLPARLRIGKTEVACRVGNLSTGGVFVVGPSLPAGTRVKLLIRAPFLDNFDPVCIASWCTEFGTGLQFEGLGAVDTYMLARFIGRASRATAPLPTDAVLRPPAT